MNVLFLSSMYYRPTGTYAGLAVHRQAVELHRRGLNIRVLCPVPRFKRPFLTRPWLSGGWDDAVQPRSLEVDGIPVTYLPFPNLPLGLLPRAHAVVLERFLAPRVERLHGRFPLDVIHAHRLFPTGFAAVRIARRLGVPVVVSAVGSDVHTHPARNRGICRGTKAALTENDAVVAVSRALADRIGDLAAPPQPVRVVYRGVDTDQFSPEPPSGEARAAIGLPKEGVGVCSVARLVRGKGIFELLEAFESIADTWPGAWLVLVGDGPLRGEVEGAIRSRGLEGRIFLAGAQPHDRISHWLNAADIFALASYNEGLPNVVLEAMACGRPIVSTDVGGVGEALEEGVSGLLVPPASSVALAAALSQLMRSGELRMRMGAAGRARVLSTFAWNRAGDELTDLYGDLDPMGQVTKSPHRARGPRA